MQDWHFVSGGGGQSEASCCSTHRKSIFSRGRPGGKLRKSNPEEEEQTVLIDTNEKCSEDIWTLSQRWSTHSQALTGRIGVDEVIFRLRGSVLLVVRGQAAADEWEGCGRRRHCCRVLPIPTRWLYKLCTKVLQLSEYANSCSWLSKLIALEFLLQNQKESTLGPLISEIGRTLHCYWPQNHKPFDRSEWPIIIAKPPPPEFAKSHFPLHAHE